MKTQLTASDLPDSLTKVRHQIERDVPVGFNHHKDIVLSPVRDSPGKQDLEGLALKHRIDTLMPRFDALQIMVRVGKFDHVARPSP